jgi:OOP family OmpA-OmpF porin
MKHIFFLVFFVLMSIVQAQELVPDGGFENVQRLPTKENNHIFCTKNWVTPNATNTDYYHQEAEDGAVRVPLNRFGKQEAHSGKAYAGICIEENFIEYIESPLTQALEKDKEYLIEFYISQADFRLAKVKEFGLMFLDKVRFSYAKRGIPNKPPVNFYLKKGYKNNKDWVKLSATYTAEGFEKAFILGYFNYDYPKGYPKKAHYYIDDVSITEVIHVNSTKGK